MVQVLYRKWRPQQWEQVVGQEHIVQTLRNAIVAERVAHAYLFAGPRGTGKTTVARLLAKAVNCLDEDLSKRPCDQCDHCMALNQGRFLDLIEIDAASNTSVDDVRDLRDKINFSPNLGRYKVYIIDEVHMLSTAAFNALLKTLEEPPPHAIFILATTEIHKIPATVLSRCQRHEFRRIPLVDIVAYIKEIAREEQLLIEDEALTLIARQATGSMRDAISLLDQLGSTEEEITLQLAESVLGTASNQAVMNLVDALIEDDSAAGLDHIHKALDAGSDPRQFARQVVDYLRNLLLVRMGSDEQINASAEVRGQMANQAREFSTDELLQSIRNFNQAANDARSTWQASLPLELGFIESLNRSTEESEYSGAAGQTGDVRKSKTLSEAREAKQTSSQEAAKTERAQASPDISPEDKSVSNLLSQNWRKILNFTRQRNPRTYGLLNSTRLRYIKNNVLILGFSSDLLVKQMEKQENLNIVVEALESVLDKKFTIRCLTTTAKGSELPTDVDNDGMVAAALRDLGGEIVDIQ